MGHFNNKIKQYEQKPGRQAGRQADNCSTTNIHTRRKTMDQPRTADTRTLNRETNEGNEGDTGGPTETMIS